MNVPALVAAVQRWPEPERKWWRQLLEGHPSEALVVAEAALLLNAWPQDENGWPAK